MEEWLEGKGDPAIPIKDLRSEIFEKELSKLKEKKEEGILPFGLINLLKKCNIPYYVLFAYLIYKLMKRNK